MKTMARAKSLDRVINSFQNGEATEGVVKNTEENSELEYWKKKALELEEKQNSQSQQYAPVSQGDMIEVISLCNDKLNLNTKHHGMGNLYSFEYFGEKKSIMFSELNQIKETQRNFARKGYFLINDPAAVKMLGLEEDYKKVLTVEKINSILSNSPDAENLFKVANDGQKNIIIDMLIEKIVMGEDVDMNLIYKLSKISGIDINQRVMAQKESIERNKLED